MSQIKNIIKQHNFFYYQKIIQTVYMLQKSNNQQTTYTLLPNNSQLILRTHNTITDDQLRISLQNINQIMQKINEVVKRSQKQKLVKQNKNVYRNQQKHTFVTHENLLTQNIDNEQTQLVKKLKNKMNGLKIPLHQLHKKNKLSTVIEESQSQSGRTTYNGITPRDYQNLSNIEPKLEYQSKTIRQNYCFNKQTGVIFNHCKSLQESQKKDIDGDIDRDGQKITKKITGIRKTSNFKINQSDNLQKSKDKQNRIYFKNQQKQQKFIKTRSMANLKSSLLLSKKQLHFQDNDISHTNSIKNSKSKSRKGLSLFSKHSLLNDNNEQLLKSIDNTTRHKNKTTSQISSETKNSKTIVIKRRTINPFLIQKKSVQLQKKNQGKNQNKNKNCLSRTNIRQFFVSKRIKR